MCNSLTQLNSLEKDPALLPLFALPMLTLLCLGGGKQVSLCCSGGAYLSPYPKCWGDRKPCAQLCTAMHSSYSPLGGEGLSRTVSSLGQ